MACAAVVPRVNGIAHRLTLDTRTSLLDALREHIGLTGSKQGCDHGQFVNRDLASDHVAVNAEVPSIEVDWIDEHDSHVDPMGAEGIGEIGIVGTAAAVANAALDATGERVRKLPITPEKLVPHLVGRFG